MQKHCIKSSGNICFGFLLELPRPGNSNKYPKHTFYEEIRIKQDLSYISFCPLRILYNSKFIIVATFSGTNAVVVTRVHCIGTNGPRRAKTCLWDYADSKGPDQPAHLQSNQGLYYPLTELLDTAECMTRVQRPR